MPKLHELLAVDSNLKNQADKTRSGLMETFEKKRHLFSEKIVTFRPLTDGAQPVTESQLDLQTTVPSELIWLKPFLAKAMDVQHQIAEANTKARADVVLDGGELLLSDMPATALLELEKRIAELHAFVDTIPTLDPAKGFRSDPDRGKSIYRARDEVKARTQKIQEPLVLYPATKEHPAQVKELSVDRAIGTVLTQEWSGLITPAEKANILARTEQVARAVKQARARANEVEVDTSAKIGDLLLTFIFGL